MTRRRGIKKVHRNDPEMSAVEQAAIRLKIRRWRKAWLAGVAGPICDEIVRSRPVPPDLMGVIFSEMKDAA